MITVYLINDHPSMRAVLRLRLELETDIAVIGEGPIDEDTYVQVMHCAPDVVVLDVMLRIVDRSSTISIISRLTLSSAVIVLSLYDDPTTQACAAAAGALAVIPKHEGDEVLLAAIRCAANAPGPRMRSGGKDLGIGH